MNNHDEDNLFQYNPKILSMYELLSDERKNEMRVLISETISKLKESGKLEYGRMYPFETTKAFDQESPKQFVYMKCIFKIDEIPYENIINKFGSNDITDKLDNKPITTVKMIIEDIDVYKEDNFFDWIDHVNRINEQNSNKDVSQLFYENNIFKNDENKDKGGNQTKIECIDFKKDSNQSKKMEMMDEIIQNNLINNSNKNTDFNPNGYDINIEEINNSDFFDFYYHEAEKLSSDEYLSVLKLYAIASLNASMNNLIKNNHLDPNKVIFNSLSSLKTLQSRFSNCNFWEINKQHLLEMGFINFNNEMLLIPFWALPVILKNSAGKILPTKSGEELIITNDIQAKDIDFSNSYGCTIYGINISDLKK